MFSNKPNTTHVAGLTLAGALLFPDSARAQQEEPLPWKPEQISQFAERGFGAEHIRALMMWGNKDESGELVVKPEVRKAVVEIIKDTIGIPPEWRMELSHFQRHDQPEGMVSAIGKSFAGRVPDLSGVLYFGANSSCSLYFEFNLTDNPAMTCRGDVQLVGGHYTDGWMYLGSEQLSQHISELDLVGRALEPISDRIKAGCFEQESSDAPLTFELNFNRPTLPIYIGASLASGRSSPSIAGVQATSNELVKLLDDLNNATLIDSFSERWRLEVMDLPRDPESQGPTIRLRRGSVDLVGKFYPSLGGLEVGERNISFGQFTRMALQLGEFARKHPYDLCFAIAVPNSSEVILYFDDFDICEPTYNEKPHCVLIADYDPRTGFTQRGEEIRFKSRHSLGRYVSQLGHPDAFQHDGELGPGYHRLDRY